MVDPDEPELRLAPRRPPSPASGPVPGADHEDAAAFAVLMIGVTFAALLPMGPWYADLDLAAVLLSVLHVLACCAGAVVAVYRGLRPCLLVASVFPYCWLALPAVYQISHTEAAWGDPGVTLDSKATLTALAIILVGQVTLLGAYLLVPRRREASRPPTPLSPEGRTRLTLTIGLLLLLCLGLLPLVISTAGGIGAMFTSREDLNASLESNGLEDGSSPVAALVKIVPSALSSVVVLLAIHLFRTRRGPGDIGVRVAVVVGATALAMLCVVANPFASTRFLFLVSFGPLALVVLRPYRRLAAFVWLGGCVFAFLLAYPLAELFRRSESVGSNRAMLASIDFDGFQQVINTVSFVSAEGIAWGSHFLSGLLFFVPRSMWEAKSDPASLEIASARGYEFLNLSLPFPAEAYLDGGWLGVLLVMVLFGVLLAVLDRAWREKSHWALVAAFLALAQVGLWRGPFGSQVPVFAFAGGLLVLALVLAHGRGSPAAPPTPIDQVDGSAADDRGQRRPASRDS